jgi:hypothetical protein
MNGLLKYDFYSIKQTVRIYVILLAISAASVSVFYEIHNFLLSFSAIVLIQVPLVLFRTREAAHADKMLRLLPLSSGQIVLESYAVLLLLFLIAVALDTLSLVLSAASHTLQPYDITAVYLTLLISGALASMLMAICFRFGLAKASAIFVGIVLVFAIAGYAIISFISGETESSGIANGIIEKITSIRLQTIVLWCIIVSLAAIMISIFASIRTYQSKEL